MRSTMIKLRSVLLVAALLETALHADDSPSPVPDYFGHFSVDKGQLVELKKLVDQDLTSMMSGSTFTGLPNPPASSEVQFIVYGDLNEPKLARTTETSPGKFHVDWEDEVILRVSPVHGQDSMYRLKPAEPLAPGLYILSTVACPENGWDFRCYYPISTGKARQAVGISTPPPTAAVQEPRHLAPVETGLGFEVIADAALYSTAETTEVKAHLVPGTICANAKGHSLGTPNEFRLEERAGRTHIVYVQDLRLKEGWVESSSIARFAYDCACSPARCTPVIISLRKGVSWNDCFSRAVSERKPSS